MLKPDLPLLIIEIPRMLRTLPEHVPPSMLEHACLLNNLAQEMAAQDERFRLRIAELFSLRVDALQAAFERGQQAGRVRHDVNCRVVARFVIAAVEGCIGLFKAERAMEQWAPSQSQIASYLNTLKPDFTT